VATVAEAELAFDNLAFDNITHDKGATVSQPRDVSRIPSSCAMLMHRCLRGAPKSRKARVILWTSSTKWLADVGVHKS
jgi:hypothetical protein